jgi:hypothetical protein
MTNQDDFEFQKRLASYHVAEADHNLLDKIVQMASATPQDKKVAWTFPVLSAFEFTPWRTATAFALVAVLGFGIGAALPTSPSVATTQRAFSVNNTDLNKIIFGSTTLKEVNI